MERVRTMPLGVVVERRQIDNPWQDHEWRPVAVIPGAGPVDGWRQLNSGAGWTQYHAATLPLELHRKETEAYRTALAENPPVLYVVLRPGEEADEPEVVPFLVTASPYEAQDYLDSGDDIVEPVLMPDAVVAWVQVFVDKHHVDEPFHKRRRRRADEDAEDALPAANPPRGPARLRRRHG